MIVAIDSFDTPHAGCTTLTATLLALHLASQGFRMLDYPRLVRLNPAVPWKTRGNAAVALTFEGDAEELFSESKRFLEKVPGKGALAVGESFPPIYERAIERVIDPKDVLKEFDGLWWGRPESLVGAIAAGSARDLRNFELIAYRVPENLTKPRRCSFHPIYEALSDLFFPLIHESDPEVVCPRGWDPVLLGIRGSYPPALWEALKAFRGEPIALATMFRTNQHSYDPSPTTSLYPYDFGKVHFEGSYELRREDVMFGDYVLFKETGITKVFKVMSGWRNKVRADLDVISKPGIKEVAAIKNARIVFWRKEAPRCPRCGGSMTSLGKRTLKRRCKKCGFTAEALSKIKVVVVEGSLYPVQGRKLHLEGDYRGPPIGADGRICEFPGCAIWVAHGFAHH
ncbi:MAG: DUF1743 domain-containing protein [Crenarchaeota archaeon]|nr:DUF1743 domain-containing protein [Thermoproteota archaeon]